MFFFFGFPGSTSSVFWGASWDFAPWSVQDELLAILAT